MQYLIIYASVLIGLMLFIWVLERDRVLAILKVYLLITIMCTVGVLINIETSRMASIDYSTNISEALSEVDTKDDEETFISLRDYFTNTLGYSAFTCIKKEGKYTVSFYSPIESKIVILEVEDGTNSK